MARSDRLLQLLHDVAGALQRHPRVPVVADRLEEYRSVTAVGRRTGVNPTRTDIVIRTYGPGQIAPLVDTIADIWADAHPEIVDTPGAATDGLSVPALRRQVLGHVRHHQEGFTLVAAYAHGAMIGFGYASPCTPDYWSGPELLPQIPEHVRAGRLMGLCELAVTLPWQGQGIGPPCTPHSSR